MHPRTPREPHARSTSRRRRTRPAKAQANVVLSCRLLADILLHGDRKGNNERNQPHAHAPVQRGARRPGQVYPNLHTSMRKSCMRMSYLLHLLHLLLTQLPTRLRELLYRVHARSHTCSSALHVQCGWPRWRTPAQEASARDIHPERRCLCYPLNLLLFVTLSLGIAM